LKLLKRSLACLVLCGTGLLLGCSSKPYAIYTADAPKPVGPYSQAIVAGNLVFGAGQLGIDPKQGKIIAETADGQMAQAIQNMFAVLHAAGSDPTKLVKVTVYFKDLNDFEKVNVVYEKMLGNNRPARAAIQADRIPLDALIEIDYIAVR
jgi:2-iminobutanoate/2-iminopropanoate deaminase